MIGPLLLLFLLGALQGVIGWVMVKSGLNEENLYVSHIRLAIHFVSAMILICYALLFGLKLVIPQRDRITDVRLRRFTLMIIGLLTVQLFYGAFMAGLKGAGAAPTWPDINGQMVPALFPAGSLTDNLFFNVITIHFIHRTLACILFILIVFWWRKARLHTASVSFGKMRIWPLLLVAVQVLLGILAVLNSPGIIKGHFGIFEWLAELHQLTGMLLLLSLIASLYMIKPKPAISDTGY
jgi:cytochrome c oxidase assembly protein subunit 15